MRKLILLLIIFLIPGISFSQIKQRSVSTNVYTGIGFKVVILTDPAASDAYPFFQFSGGDFLKEIDGFLGVTINETYGVEFSPGYLFTNSNNSDGFYFGSGIDRRYYVPTQTRLISVPLNLRVKYYPFGKNYTSTLSKAYLGFGGGTMYISEEIVGDYYAEDEFTRIGSFKADDSAWSGNFEFLLGISSFSKIGYGFELSYRFVPLNNVDDKPLITALSSNFNSINLAANILFSF